MGWKRAYRSDEETYQVFVSHSSRDTWVARQIAAKVEETGASCFLDEFAIEPGDDFNESIRDAALVSDELVVLITPWAIPRPYIWIEIGAFWSARKRIVGVLCGLSTKDVSTDERIPPFLKTVSLLEINDLDSYFRQLRRRVAAREAKSTRRSAG